MHESQVKHKNGGVYIASIIMVVCCLISGIESGR